MNGGVFKSIFLFIVEYEAIFIEKAHNRGLPPWASQEVNYNIKEPILYSIKS